MRVVAKRIERRIDSDIDYHCRPLLVSFLQPAQRRLVASELHVDKRYQEGGKILFLGKRYLIQYPVVVNRLWGHPAPVIQALNKTLTPISSLIQSGQK